jgi:hypothetical protein
VILTTAFYADGKEEKICANQCSTELHNFSHFVSGQSEMLVSSSGLLTFPLSFFQKGIGLSAPQLIRWVRPTTARKVEV